MAGVLKYHNGSAWVPVSYPTATSEQAGVIKVANNVTTTTEGFALDARQGKALQDQISNLWNIIYPIGSIYMSVNSTSPATLFGGTWEQIKDKFLLACGDSYINGSTGGQSTHTHTISHTHTVPGVSHNHGLSAGYAQIGLWSDQIVYNRKAVTSWTATRRSLASGWNTVTISSACTDAAQLGGSTDSKNPGSTTTSAISTSTSGSGNNLPPYLAVNIWKRTA